MHILAYVFHDEETDPFDLISKYDENLGVRERVCSVDEIISKLKEQNAEAFAKAEKIANGDKELLAEEVADYYGYVVDDDGVYSTFNPEGRWDWYEAGGRWNGTIPGNEARLKDLNIDALTIPYAFVNTDGYWHENNYDEEEWKYEFLDYAKSLDGETIVTCIDFHR